MPSKTKTKKVWALVLAGGGYELLVQDDQHELLEDALLEGRKQWVENYVKKGVKAMPNLSMHSCVDVAIEPIMLAEKPQLDYEQLVFLLSDYLKSEEGKHLKNKGWICRQSKSVKAK